MRNTNAIRLASIIGAGLASIITAAAQGAEAGDESRGGRYEVFALGQYNTLSAATFTSAGIGTPRLKVGNWETGGLGLGYNFTDHLSISTAVTFGSASVGASAAGIQLGGHATVIGTDLAFTYNILKGKFTPYLTAGGGTTTFAGDFGAGNDFSETDFQYGGGGGLRWDISRRWYAKAEYRVNLLRLKDADANSLMHQAMIGIGFKF